MTKEELNRRRMMFQINAKRNELLKPEDIGISTVRHSATNDFLAFRKKVAAGMKKQKEQNVEVFNVTAANLQNYQDMLDNNELIHAGTGEFKPTYYQKVENAFGPGKHRYFYTKEEWDAYQNELAGYRKKADDYVKNRDANSNAGANRGAKDSTVATAQKYKKESEQNVQRRESLQNMQSSREAAMKSGQQATQKMTEQRQQTLNNAQSGRESAIKNSESMVAPKKGAKDAVKDLANSAKAKVKDAVYKEAAKAEAESIKSDAARWNKYDQKVKDQVMSKYSDIKTVDDFLARAEKEGGVKNFYDNLEKEMKTLQNNIDSSNKPGADRAANESSGNKKSSENKSNGDTAEERQKKILDDAFKEGANADDLASKYGVSTDYIRELVYNVSGKTVPTKRDLESQKSNNDTGSNKTGNVSKEYQQELEANSKKNTYELKSGPSNNSSKSSSGPIEFTMENGKTVVKKKSAKHDGLEDGITTSAELTPDQEYIAFRKKVEAGIKHFGTTRGLMTIPKNQALADGDSMSHAGIPSSYKKLATGLNNMKNYGYYNKIDNAYGPGKPRYFYSKEEWDAYQNEKNKAYDKAKADVKARNEAIEAARPKSNVEQAQYARQQEEKKGQRETQRQQEEGISKRTNNSVKVADDILDTIKTYSHNKEIGHKIDELRKKYDLKAAGYGDGPYKYHQDEEYRKLMNPYVKGNKTVDRSENINADNDFNRMNQIEHEYSQKYYKDLMNDVKDIVHSDPKDAEWIMYQLMSRSSVKDAMNNSNEVYDEIIKALKELNVSTAGFKPIEVKEIEVKPIEVKKIK